MWDNLLVVWMLGILYQLICCDFNTSINEVIRSTAIKRKVPLKQINTKPTRVFAYLGALIGASMWPVIILFWVRNKLLH